MYLWAGHHALVADMFKAPGAADAAGSDAISSVQVPSARTVKGDKFAALQDTAAVLLEYKGPDSQDAIVVLQGVHDPALEEAAPASSGAAAAAMREARLISKDEAVLDAARSRGAELAASLARLRVEESKLRLKEGWHPTNSLNPSPALARDWPLLRGHRQGPVSVMSQEHAQPRVAPGRPSARKATISRKFSI